jgi:hypothetical protein
MTPQRRSLVLKSQEVVGMNTIRNTVRIELDRADASEVIANLVKRYESKDLNSELEPTVIDCQAISSLDYATLQHLLQLRGKCIFTGMHKLEACLQLYGISNLSDQLPTYTE